MMNTLETQEKILNILKDESNLSELNQCTEITEVISFFNKHGVTVEEADAKQFVKIIYTNNNEDEIDEKELDSVSGGVAVTSTWVFYSAFKIVKNFGGKLYELGQKGVEKGWW